MDGIERRAFMQGAGLARSPSRWAAPRCCSRPARRARKACRCARSSPTRRRPSRRWARRWFPARARPASPISSISRSRSRPRRRCSRRASSTSGRPMPTSIAPRSARSTARARRSSGKPFAQLDAAEQHDFVDQHAPEQDRRLAGPGRSPSSTWCCAATPSTSSTAPWRATTALGIPYMPHIAPTKRW